MTLEERIAIIEGNLQKRLKEQKNKNDEIFVQNVTALLKLEMLKDRIQNILILANKCTDCRIGIPSKMYSKYSESKAVGLVGEKGKEVKYLGFYVNGNPVFYTDGVEATSAGGNTLFISQLKEPGRPINLDNIGHFLRKFEKFETQFYKWTDALETRTGMESPLWCENLTLNEWLGKHENDPQYMEHFYTYSEDWVRSHFATGDVAILWLEYVEGEPEPNIVHSYIKRGEYFVDIRGETDSEEEMREGFEPTGETARCLCHDLDDFKTIVRRIKHYTDRLWQNYAPQKYADVFDAELEEILIQEIEDYENEGVSM